MANFDDEELEELNYNDFKSQEDYQPSPAVEEEPRRFPEWRFPQRFPAAWSARAAHTSVHTLCPKIRGTSDSPPPDG